MSTKEIIDNTITDQSQTESILRKQLAKNHGQYCRIIDFSVNLGNLLAQIEKGINSYFSASDRGFHQHNTLVALWLRLMALLGFGGISLKPAPIFRLRFKAPPSGLRPASTLRQFRSPLE